MSNAIKKKPALDESETYLGSRGFERALAEDDGAHTRALLASGCPIILVDQDDPDVLVRLLPDGRRQVVDVGPQGEVSVIRDL